MQAKSADTHVENEADWSGDRLWVSASALAAFVAAVVVTVAVSVTDGPIPGDVTIALFIQDYFPIGSFAGGLRSMNNTEALTVSASVATIGLWFAGRRRHAALLVAGMAVLVIFTLALKYFVDRDRPDPDLIHVGLPGRSPGYPSGHAITSTLFFGYLVYMAVISNVPLRLRFVAAAAGIGMVLAAGIATTHTGVHWPSDVYGGYLWGAALMLCLVAADRVLARRGFLSGRTHPG